MTRTAHGLSRQYAKLCGLGDFADPQLGSLISEIAPALSAKRPHRKGWEFAMGALFLADTGHLAGDAEILDLGAGSEEILYWMANRARRVVAVDIYGRGAFGDREAVASMLDDPAAHAPYGYPAAALEVCDMDARHLDFDAASFDAVVCFSSIEHFGGPDGIAASAREIGRVLRPGGHALLVTEVFVHQGLLERTPVQFAARVVSGGRRCATATPRRRAVEVLKASEVQRDIIGPSGLRLMQPLDLSVDAQTRAAIQPLHRDGTPAGDAAAPHVLLRTGASQFTSACLPLVKPA